ncbi:hypothetical protein F5Y11DRAFT_333861 [Daldinia sp. FL1419]|nr:hypothetical protein F5Y11DRAFT_333861 [Daldinia sp. FL1419]
MKYSLLSTACLGIFTLAAALPTAPVTHGTVLRRDGDIKREESKVDVSDGFKRDESPDVAEGYHIDVADAF